MPQKIFEVEGLGKLLIVKRKSSRHLRLSIGSNSQIMVSQPIFVPFRIGLAFALDRRQWITAQLAKRSTSSITDNMPIGKSYRLKLQSSNTNKRFKTQFLDQEVRLTIPSSADQDQILRAASKAIEAALHRDAEKLLKLRIEDLAKRFDYQYKDLRFKKLTARWGSCSSQKIISLSIYLIQLPWHLIDYVLLHELAHLKYMNHQKEFWNELGKNLNDVSTLRKEIRKYNPGIIN